MLPGTKGRVKTVHREKTGRGSTDFCCGAAAHQLCVLAREQLGELLGFSLANFLTDIHQGLRMRIKGQD